jgi:trehalose utilization protein
MDRIVTVTDTPTLLAQENHYREELSLENQGSVLLYWNEYAEVATSGTKKGRMLGAGFYVHMNKERYPETIKKQVYGICEAGKTTTIRVYEQ